MKGVDPHFEQIARRLTSLQLRASSSSPEREEEDELLGRVHRFVGMYSADGIRTVIKEYGLDDKLAALGLGDYQLELADEDAYRHRMKLVLPGGKVLMDMRLHLCSVSLPEIEEHADVVVVEWLLMQNPRAPFTRERPRLPGQSFPGTGLGRDVTQLLVLMCRRIGRDGLVTVPERFHLAELYARGGWRAHETAAAIEVDTVAAAARRLSFAARAWAVERGCVHDTDTGARYAYAPHERVLPVSDKLARAFAPGGFLWLARVVLGPARTFSVDVDALRASLAADPVEGMDPDQIGL